MKIGIESNAYFGVAGAREGLARLKEHGYQAIDYQMLVDTENELYAMNDADFERTVIEHGRLAAEAGIEISQSHGPWRWPPRDVNADDRNERFQKMSKALRATRLAGGKYMVVHPIMPFGVLGNKEPEKVWEMNIDFYRRLCTVAEQENVIICLENMPFPEFSISRPEEILALVRAINSPFLRVCLDTGHCAVCGVSPADAARLLGTEYMKVMHVHDNNGMKDFHWLPYNGVIDWADFTRALHEIGFEGTLSLECSVSKKLPESIREYHEKGLALIAKTLIQEEFQCSAKGFAWE